MAEKPFPPEMSPADRAAECAKASVDKGAPKGRNEETRLGRQSGGFDRF